jgi:hypothetical protein
MMQIVQGYPMFPMSQILRDRVARGGFSASNQRTSKLRVVRHQILILIQNTAGSVVAVPVTVHLLFISFAVRARSSNPKPPSDDR